MDFYQATLHFSGPPIELVYCLQLLNMPSRIATFRSQKLAIVLANLACDLERVGLVFGLT
jgi:hypothetical protein